jgi:hypothetical protein
VCDPDLAPTLQQILGPDDRGAIMVNRLLFVKVRGIRFWWALITGHGV